MHFDPVGERLSLVDERGAVIDDERALLVVLDLVAAETRKGTVALPVTLTRVAERVAAFHGVEIRWIGLTPAALSQAVADDAVVFGGDGRGGFVVPQFSHTVDGIAAFVQLVGLVARTQLQLSEIDARIPQSHVARRSVPTPWAAKGVVMRVGHRGRRRPGPRHHRRRAGRRAGRQLGARPARPRRAGDAHLGRGGRRRAAARRCSSAGCGSLGDTER